MQDYNGTPNRSTTKCSLHSFLLQEVACGFSSLAAVYGLLGGSLLSNIVRQRSGMVTTSQRNVSAMISGEFLLQSTWVYNFHSFVSSHTMIFSLMHNEMTSMTEPFLTYRTDQHLSGMDFLMSD